VHGTTCPFSLGQYGADLLGRADVVGELDPRSAVTAECLIKRTGSGKIGDAKRHKADALVHQEIIADAAGCAVRPK
jgi:hypothetical protein